jgi:hypothetical protein
MLYLVDPDPFLLTVFLIGAVLWIIATVGAPLSIRPLALNLHDSLFRFFESGLALKSRTWRVALVEHAWCGSQSLGKVGNNVCPVATGAPHTLASPVQRQLAFLMRRNPALLSA